MWIKKNEEIELDDLKGPFKLSDRMRVYFTLSLMIRSLPCVTFEKQLAAKAKMLFGLFSFAF